MHTISAQDVTIQPTKNFRHWGMTTRQSGAMTNQSTGMHVRTKAAMKKTAMQGMIGITER